MLGAIFQFLLNLIFWLIGLIGSIIIYPVQAIIVSIFPTLGTYISAVLTFFNEYIFKYISFCKELFLDISCLPRPLFSLLVTFILAKWALAPAIRSILLVINIWKIKSGGDTN